MWLDNGGTVLDAEQAHRVAALLVETADQLIGLGTAVQRRQAQE